MIQFSANIRIVTPKVFWQQLPAIRSQKTQLSSYPYELTSSKPLDKRLNPVNRYTDYAYGCVILATKKRLFHLRPSINKGRFKAELENILSDETNYRQATLMGGYSSDQSSEGLKETVKSALAKTGHEVRKLCGKAPYVGSNAYFSRKGNIWISLGCALGLSHEKVTKGDLRPIKPINTLNWLRNIFSEVVLLPDDKLFIGNSEKPLITGAYSHSRGT